jgi:hypothetical protein
MRGFSVTDTSERLRVTKICEKLVSQVPEAASCGGECSDSCDFDRGAAATKLSELLRSGSIDPPTVKLRRKLFTDRQRDELIRSAHDPGRSLEDERARQCHAAWRARQMENCLNGDSINQASALELGGYLPNTLLRDTDVASMAHGLEVRVALLDHLLIERLLRIDGRIKLKGTASGRCKKWLLVRAAGDLPAEIVERRKRGFEIPFALWFRGALRSRIEESLRAPGLERVLNREAIQGVWSDFLAGRTTWSRVWALFVLSNWIETHLDERDYQGRRLEKESIRSIIDPASGHRAGIGMKPLDPHDLWRYRELFYFLTWRDVKVRYKQTSLGGSVGSAATARKYAPLHASLRAAGEAAVGRDTVSALRLCRASAVDILCQRR